MGTEAGGEKDRYIMSMALLQRYSIRQQTPDINLVRIYFQNTTLNDMIDPAEPEKSQVGQWRESEI